MAMLANHKPFVLPCTVNIRRRRVCHMPHGTVQHLPHMHIATATIGGLAAFRGSLAVFIASLILDAH